MNNRIHSLRRWAVMLSLSLAAVASHAETQFSIGISVPGVNIGINTPAYPRFVRVPNYPVYYAPGSQNNYFFYDGLYWVYQRDNWYSSSWYDGPWYAVGPQYVPLYVLRVPVRYYRNPPPYFGGWQRDAPPRWGEHWGNDWQRQRSGWDRWNRSAVPAPAPLPTYQRQYAGERYPRVEQQRELQGRSYRYQPRDTDVRQRYQQQAVPPAAAPARRPPQEGAQRPPSRPQQGQGPQQGQRNGNGKAKGQDKDREDKEAPGQQRKN
jgi:hypothetical protein